MAKLSESNLKANALCLRAKHARRIYGELAEKPTFVEYIWAQLMERLLIRGTASGRNITKHAFSFIRKTRRFRFARPLLEQRRPVNLGGRPAFSFAAIRVPASTAAMLIWRTATTYRRTP
jgi:hypothetical protein